MTLNYQLLNTLKIITDLKGSKERIICTMNDIRRKLVTGQNWARFGLFILNLLSGNEVLTYLHLNFAKKKKKKKKNDR